jgi:hypothetical protein
VYDLGLPSYRQKSAWGVAQEQHEQQLRKKEFRKRSDANLRTAREVDARQVACD